MSDDRLPIAAPARDRCLNCGEPLTGEFCVACGQKRPNPDLTLRELAHEATNELVHIEGKVPATLKALFFKPGFLTLEFLAGRRARWLSPLRLYLLCSIVYFLAEPLVERITHRGERAMASMTTTAPDGRRVLTPAGRAQIEASGVLVQMFGRERVEHAIVNVSGFSRALNESYSKAMFVLLPVFALLTSVAWRAQLPRYPAHLYLALHIHAAAFGAMAIASLATVLTPQLWLSIALESAAVVYGFVYAAIALKRVFGESWARILGKGAAIGILYGAFLSGVTLLLLAYAIATMTAGGTP